MNPQDVQAQVDRAKAMVAQTLAEKDKPFAGSSYDMAKPPTTPLPNTPAVAPVETPVPLEYSSLGVTPEQFKQLSSPEGMDPMAFSGLINQINTKLQTNNELTTQKNLVLQQLYGTDPLTPDMIAKLPPDMQKVVQSGNPAEMEFQVRLLNEQIAGRGNTLNQSIQYLTQGYQTQVAEADKLRQQHIDQAKYILSNTPSAVLRKTYSPPQLNALEASLGLPLGTISDPNFKTDKDVSMELAAQKAGGTSDDVMLIANAIESGTQPPDLSRLYGKSAAVRAQLARDGYDLTKATLDWTATQKFVTNSNNAQQIRMRQAESSVEQSLPNLQYYVDKLNADGAMTGFQFVNRASIEAAKNGAFGKEAANDAQALLGQISLVTDELGQTFMGGNSPTDAAFSLAKGVLSGNFTPEQFSTQINLISQNLQIRKNSWATAGVVTLGGANTYGGGSASGTDYTSTLDSIMNNM